MSKKRPRYNYGLNLFILAGVLMVAVLHSYDFFPADNLMVSGLAYLVGAILGVAAYSGFQRLKLSLNRE